MRLVQGHIPARVFADFDAAVKDVRIGKQDCIAALATLFTRLPPVTQRLLTLALRDDVAFTDFMRAVDQVILDRIVSLLPASGEVLEEMTRSGSLFPVDEETVRRLLGAAPTAPGQPGQNEAPPGSKKGRAEAQ